MSKFTHNDEKRLDEQITEFADRVLDTNEEIDMDNINKADELAKLQKTILVLKAAVNNAQPDESVRARIHKNLQSAVRTEKAREKTMLMPRKVSGFALAGGFALLILVGLVLTPLSGAELPLSGTAEGSQVWLPLVVIIAGVAIITFLAWLNRQR
jgi:hypothetical protein